MNNEFFKQTLANFTHDVASGDAIRHLADKGYTVPEIAKELDFPTPIERIRKTVWEHYINTGVIRFEPPEEGTRLRVHYEKVYGAFGKTSFKRVEEEIKEIPREYRKCEFGKEKYGDAKAFELKLERLDAKDREYVENLPWPLQPVYHVADERIKRIMQKFE
ncbi:hypothetical protein SAMN02910358_01596 [Lachnospiraceae bacterium XBB1006]|nr:hypothetical protein SAMN02910358_01596 [Lachnospiraceae bacterium XBB1006]